VALAAVEGDGVDKEDDDDDVEDGDGAAERAEGMAGVQDLSKDLCERGGAAPAAGRRRRGDGESQK
jgi:hypothetical protein